MGLGRDGTLHGTYESRSYLFPLGRHVSRKAGKKKIARIHFDRAGNSLYCLGLHVILLGSLLNILEGFHSYRGRLQT